MNAHSPNSQFAFQLPSMSYIDAKWEEPELRSTPASVGSRRRGRIAALIAAFKEWRERQQALIALRGMTDRELKDIGLTRGDLGRVAQGDLMDQLHARG
jgi:uncharacterized protein YjiS (DUF1127 family)